MSVTDGESLYVALPELIAGATAGFAEHFVMFPFDTVKTRMQSDATWRLTASFAHIFRRERVAHLYRGCTPVLLSAVPAHGAYFGAYEAAKRLLGGYGNAGIVLCACCAAVAHDFVSTPFDVVKQRMQMDSARAFASSLQCARSIVRHEGVRALYVSLPTTVMMNIPHFATYWLVYEGFMRCQAGDRHAAVVSSTAPTAATATTTTAAAAAAAPRRDSKSETTGEHLLGGLLAGGAASVVSFPFDTVKTQLQLGRSNSAVSALQHLLRTRGVAGMFAGVLARALYTAPSGAIMMVTYEATKSFLSFEEGQL